MKKYVLSLAALTVLGMSYSLMNRQMDARSHGSGMNTGMGFTSCAASGCHSGPVKTSDDITLEVLDGGAPVSAFTPGKNYMVRFTTSMSNAKFGFALAANLGSLSIGPGMQKIGLYLTHTANGTAADPSGGKSWIAQWTAPSTGTAATDFHLYINATNNDGTNNGDEIFEKKISLDIATGLAHIINEKSLSVYPNPATEKLNIGFELKESANVRIALYDMNGRLVKEIASGKMNSGMQHVSVETGLPQGIYMTQVKAGEQVLTKRVFIR